MGTNGEHNKFQVRERAVQGGGGHGGASAGVAPEGRGRHGFC